MKFEWDAEKERVNVEQRGISFRLAARVFLDVAHVTLIDDRQDYGETRYLTYGKIDGHALYTQVCTTYSAWNAATAAATSNSSPFLQTASQTNELLHRKGGRGR